MADYVNGIPLIFDRTQADVDFAAANKDGNIALKGAYNAEDYNRVGEALNYLSDRLYVLGYGFNPKLKTDWQATDNFTVGDGENYRIIIKQIRDSFLVLPTMPLLPEHIHQLFRAQGFVWANNIEKLLIEIESVVQRMVAAFQYCGDPNAYCGG